MLDLPQTFDEWLMGIGKKERHEVRRKRRRFEAEFGPASIVPGGNNALATFCSMHRESEGEKGSFMTGSMEQFSQISWKMPVLSCTHWYARPHPCHRLWLGNRGRLLLLQLGVRLHSSVRLPGVVLFSSMIEMEIQRGAKVFDFLKGDESYKFRHGAKARQLFVIEGQIP